MVARDRPYSELLGDLGGKKVAIWACNTCARLCYEIGGSASAERLADALAKDGVEVLGVLHTGASCLERKVAEKNDPEIIGKADVVVSLTCNIGAHCARTVFGKEVLNPLATLGAGFVGADGRIFIYGEKDGAPIVRGLSEAAEEKGFFCSPFV